MWVLKPFSGSEGRPYPSQRDLYRLLLLLLLNADWPAQQGSSVPQRMVLGRWTHPQEAMLRL